MLVTVGTDHHPFDRLVGWAEHVAVRRPDIDVVVQHGMSRPPSSTAAAHALLPYHDLQDLLRRSSVVACHGGPATIMEVRAAGHVPVAVPRRSELGEHVDDHQVRFVSRLLDAGHVRRAEDVASFARLVDLMLEGGVRTTRPSGDREVMQTIGRVGALLDEAEAFASRNRRRRRA